MSDDVKRDPATLTPEERELGLAGEITRRDFLNTVALGTGAALLRTPAPAWRKALAVGLADGAPEPSWHPWTGYGGVGDYARSNGNTWDVVNAGHGIRDNTYERAIADAKPTGETHELVIVGGGFSGVVAAYTFLKETRRQRSCLLLENHPVIGGEAKRNEFLVRGQRLIGPQGSNQAGVVRTGWLGDMWRDIGLPSEFEFGTMPQGRRQLDLPRDNYDYLIWADHSDNEGYFFDTPEPHWVRNPWGKNLQETPWPGQLQRDLVRWHDEPALAFKGDLQALEKWLDTMTYDEYLTKFRGFDPGVARFIDPILASGAGLGADVLCALVPFHYGFPGFDGLLPGRQRHAVPGRWLSKDTGISFPGGNDGIMRALVKAVNPAAIEGSAAYAEVHNGRIRFDLMDRPNTPCRLRAGATVVRAVHDPDNKNEPATITYVKDGRLFSVRARNVIWAGASWTAKYAVQHLPAEYRAAMDNFPRAPILVVNVALNDWRPLYRLGFTCCWWQSGFGCEGNIRAPMYIGDYRPSMDPDRPTVFTMYVPLNQYGLSLVDQGNAARQKLFATTYREYELRIRQQMAKLFGGAGFDPARDIAGVVLNRWGHAIATVGPGFFYGRDGKPTPSDVLRRPLGNLTFAHSELSGNQNWVAAAQEGKRAAEQILTMM